MKTKEERKEYQRNWRENNKEKIQEYKENNKEKLRIYHIKYMKIYNQKNKEKLQIAQKKYREKNNEILKIYRKKYREQNKENTKIYHKKYQKKNQNEYNKNKRKVNTLFKLRCNLSTRTNIALKNKKYIKSKTTLDMLGCDLDTAKAHLEKQFTKGMSWENYGEWHIDHIIPCASVKTEEELIKLFHYTNLQPLWAADNMSKGKKIIEKQLFLL